MESIMKNLFAIKIVAACAGLIWATAAFCQLSQVSKANMAAPAQVASSSDSVKVSNGWVRSTVPGQKGSGAFMKITASEGTRLTGVSSPLAGVAEVHEMRMDGDVMKMRAVPVLDIPAGGTVELKPGGYHLMLMDLKQALPVGSTVPVTLMFKDGKGAESRVEVKLPVAATAPKPADTK
jgi:periplasmic copper chaperone A